MTTIFFLLSCSFEMASAIIFACGIGGNKVFRKHEEFEDIRVVLWPRGRVCHPCSGFALQWLWGVLDLKLTVPHVNRERSHSVTLPVVNKNEWAEQIVPSVWLYMWGKSSVSVFLSFYKSSLFVRTIHDHVMQIFTGGYFIWSHTCSICNS